MDILKELPIGFGMALAQNTEALEKFGSLPPEQQKDMIARAHSARSKAEMQALVSHPTSGLH